MSDSNEPLVWTVETIRWVKTALAHYAISQHMQLGMHLDDPWEVPAPPEDAWVGSVELYRLLEEDIFPGKEVDEPFFQRYNHLVALGRELEGGG